MMALAFAAAGALAAETAGIAATTDGITVGEVAKLEPTENTRFRIEMKNDSYSTLPATDFDDLRSFGLWIGVTGNNWVFGLTGDGLTRRPAGSSGDGTEADDAGSRVDELYATAGYRIVAWEIGPWSASLEAGAGALYVGYAGGSAIQDGAHIFYGTPRELPTAYDVAVSPFTALAYGAIRTGFANPIAPVSLLATGEAGHTGFARLAAFLKLAPLAAFPESGAFVGYRQAFGYDGYGATFAKTVGAENGWHVGANFRAGLLATGYSWCAASGATAGYVAVVIDGQSGRWLARGTEADKPHATTPEESATVAEGLTQGGESPERRSGEETMEVLALPLIAGMRLGYDVPIPGLPRALAVQAIVGAESGPSVLNVDGDIHHRYAAAYAGAEGEWRIVPLAGVFAGAGGGWRTDQRRTSDGSESRILEEKAAPTAYAEAGARLWLSESILRDPTWHLSACAGVSWLDTLETGWKPYFRLAVGATAHRP